MTKKATTEQLEKLEEIKNSLEQISDIGEANSLKAHALQILKDIDLESEFYDLLKKSRVDNYYPSNKSKIVNNLKQAIDYYRQLGK